LTTITFTKLRRLVARPNLSSKQVAWSFAIGLAIQMSPIPFTQALITICLCIVLKNVHKPLMLSANFINNPLTSLPITTLQIMVGNWLVGNGLRTNFEAIKWGEFNFSAILALKPLLVPYLIGSAALMIVALFLGYFSMLHYSEYMRQRKKPKAAALLSDDSS